MERHVIEAKWIGEDGVTLVCSCGWSTERETMEEAEKGHGEHAVEKMRELGG